MISESWNIVTIDEMAEPDGNTTTGPIRAFLSHATPDKHFVDVVAGRLGRQRVQYDKWVFENGVDFTAAVRGALARSGVFVLFASKAAMESLWVRIETNEAAELLRTGLLKTALVMIIDGVVTHSDLPQWMQRALIASVPNPNAASRQIEHHLNRIRGLDPNPLFIGRDSLLAEISEKLIPAPETRPPHILTVAGLSGIGRRSFLRRAMSDFLSVQVGPTFHLKPTDGIDTLHLQLLDELGALDTKESLARSIAQFQGSTLSEKANVIAQMLASSAVGNVAPVILDDGGMMDSSGGYTAETLAILEALKTYPSCVIGIVHTKRPAIQPDRLERLDAIFTRVPPLDTGSIRLLVTQMCRRHGVEVTNDQIAEIAPYIDGYPPAANLVVSLARQYGMSVLIADKSGLVDFKIRTFADALEQLRLGARQWQILRILAAEFALTLPGIVAMSGEADDAIASDLRSLIDLNLVLVSGNLFTIASPVRAAVHSLKGTLSEADFSSIAASLKSTFWDGFATLPPIEIIEATIHAVLRSKNPDLSDFRGFVIPSVLYRVSKEYYDRGGHDAWTLAQRFIGELMSVAPDHRPGLVLKAKTHVRLSEWGAARETISLIQQRGFPEYHYLMGFMLWKKRDFAKAVTEFQLALKIGQDSMEIYHGLAWCLVRLDKLAEAERVIKRGLRGRRPNSLLLDLAAHVSIIQHQYPEAEDYIDQLRRIRAFDDYNFRLATMYNAKKQFREALPHIEAAMKSPRGRFEIEATFIDTLIELRQFTRASNLLSDLDRRQRLGRDKEAVRLGLRCKMYLRQGKWQDAEQVWQQIEDKSSPVHLGLRFEILQQKIADLTTSPGARSDAQAEIQSIQKNTVNPSFGEDTEPDAEVDQEIDGDTESASLA